MTTYAHRSSIDRRFRAHRALALGLLAALSLAACRGANQPAPGAVEPGDAPIYVERDVDRDSARSVPADYVPADADFMRGMLLHHAQAIEMVALIPDRRGSDDLLLLGRRIEESQEYEIGLMRNWLEARGEPGPDPEHGHMAPMAGMATPEQMAELAAASGPAFDRLFLELMIRHHEGALTMLDELHSHEGAGVEPQVFILISHIDADQRAEIARMRRMLSTGS